MNNKPIILGIILSFLLSSLLPLIPSVKISSNIQTNESDGPMDSPWPMKCHDNRHTGRSPYSTADNPGTEKWRFFTSEGGWIDSGPVIDNNGIIYFGAKDHYLYALYPDGSLKWKYKTGHRIWSTPAIGDGGTIYVASSDKYLYAVNPDGTEKWRFFTNKIIFSSPTIDEDGTIYIGTTGPDSKFFAVYPDGSEKWCFDVEGDIFGAPVIGFDGTIFIGSFYGYFYAINSNGTLRWRFVTGDSIKGPASIADDGTVYVGSYDQYLYALHPNNGTMKWRCRLDYYSTRTNPSLGSDGTIYVGGGKLYAVNPDGSLKWSFDMGQGRWIHKSSPAISADGTIYIGTHIGDLGGGEIIAVNPDGTERWRKQIADALVDSSPCIGEDGTVYIGSNSDDYSFLHAFNTVGSNNPPDKPVITGPTTGGTGKEYNFTFSATDPDEDNIYYFIEWGDDTTSGWLGWYNSGEEITVSHTWSEPGTYNIKAKVKDYLDVESDWSTFKVSMPKHRMTNSFLIKFKEDYFHIFQLVKHYCSR